jgi:hypothetical protein
MSASSGCGFLRFPMIKENKHKEAAFERFRDFAKKIISVPKVEIDRREAAYKKSRAKLKRKSL